MLNERYLRAHTAEARAALRRRGSGPETDRLLDEWLALDGQRRAAATRRDALARQTQARREDAGTAAMEAMEERAARKALTAAAEVLLIAEARARGALLRLPNLPDAQVLDAEGYAEDAPEAGVELRRWGTPRVFDFAPKRHEELATALGILDAQRATKLAGTRFPLLVGAGARAQRALAAWMLDRHVARGYTEVAPPHLLRWETLEGSGHLPRHEDELYLVERDGLALSPTAEAQLVALHADETLAEARLPLAYTAWTPAFRREVGSARAAAKGLMRLHQFEKVELVRIATPEGADAAFEVLLADAEGVLQALELPYRVVALRANALPFAAQRTVDLEVWMAGQGRYVEISSVSDCGTFQARRLNLRFKGAGKGTARYPHTLNGSALAVGRTLAALLEHGQRADGAVALPAALAGALGTERLTVE